MKKTIIAFLATFFCVLNAYANEKVIIRLDLKNAVMRPQQIPSVVDIAGQDIKGGTIDIVGSREYFELLKDQGYPVQIVAAQTSRLDEKYLKPDEILALVKEIAARYPQIVHVEEIGKSLQGRPILAVRFSTQENLAYKPSIFFNGMHHAREIMTTEVTADIMLYLAQNFENPETPWVAQWLQQVAIWVVPQVNPDGNAIVWSEDNWWRKNGRGDTDGIFGVDLNRNYPYAWGSCGGSSGSKHDQTYRGAGPASEPETQALMSLVKAQNMAISVSYHSYSELVIAPYGCANQFTPENWIVESVGKEFASKLKKDSNRGSYDYGTGWELLYPVDGEDIGWMYNEVNTLAYVVEVNASGQGFQPDYEKWRNPTVLKQRAGWQYLINRVMTGAQVRGIMRDAKTGEPLRGELSIATVKYKSEKARSANAAGYYQKILVPGDYELVFSAPGYKSQSVPVSVAAEAPTQLDVQLERADFVGR